METVRYLIPTLEGPGDAADLTNALTGINGVAGIAVDLEARVVSVEFDPRFGHPGVIESSVIGAGYPVEGWSV